MYKVSIIVPVYQVEQYLKKCLDSLVNQTLSELEIIVVNDGSPDQSQLIIDEYVKSYPNKIFSFQKENGGLSSARNYGINIARGDYIAFVDSDDWVVNTMYEQLYNKAVSQDFDLVVCDFYEVRNGKQCACSCNLGNDIYDKDALKQAMVNFYPSAWNKLYKKERLIQSGVLFKEGVWFEDVEFIYRLLPAIDKVGVVHDNLYNYFIREGSITATADHRIFHYIDNWNGILDYYKRNQIYEEYKEELEYSYVRYLFATFIKTCLKFDKKQYLHAVDMALENVQKQFPMYKNNLYIKQRSLKNIYLRHFKKQIAILFYYIKHS